MSYRYMVPVTVTLALHHACSGNFRGFDVKCAYCDKEFVAQRKTRKFCSNACRQRNCRPNARLRYYRLQVEHDKRIDEYDKLHAEATEICEKANANQGRLLAKIAMLELELKLLKDNPGKSLEDCSRELIK